MEVVREGGVVGGVVMGVVEVRGGEGAMGAQEGVG